MNNDELVSCEFCNEMRGGTGNSFRLLFSQQEFPSRVVAETSNFVASPGLGGLLPGYLVIWPKVHCINMGALDDPELDELENFTMLLKHHVRQKTGMSTTMFEHGSTVSTDNQPVASGASIDHAHMHICPSIRDFYPATESSFVEYKIAALHNLQSWSNQNRPYIFYEDIVGQRFVFEPTTSRPSQYMRRLWAASLEVPERWDWRAFPMRDEFRATYQMFVK